MFADEATIEVTGGRGGDGVVHWRREKYVAKGGPDGGDGGSGGSIYLVADVNTDTLSNFLSKKRFSASAGSNGAKQKKHGKNGEDLHLSVPPGTLVHHDGTLVADLQIHGTNAMIAKGGRGGFGNAHFTSSVRQQPDFSELGEPGEHKKLRLELQLIADIGIIGLPSVGKSSLIAAITSAKPKIAAYEFTTIVPNLGVVDVYDRSFVVCDVPGLLEGASEGKGLGHRFLQHIERCGLLLHVLDLSHSLKDGVIDEQKLQDDYNIVRKELEAYSPTLAQKKELLILNKSDVTDAVISVSALPIFSCISAATNSGTEELKQKLLPLVLEEREKRKTEEAQLQVETPILRPQDDVLSMSTYRIEERDDGSVHICGERLEQLARMTDFSREGAVRRFQDIIERIGLRKALSKYGGQTEIYIGEKEIRDFL